MIKRVRFSNLPRKSKSFRLQTRSKKIPQQGLSLIKGLSSQLDQLSTHIDFTLKPKISLSLSPQKPITKQIYLNRKPRKDLRLVKQTQLKPGMRIRNEFSLVLKSSINQMGQICGMNKQSRNGQKACFLSDSSCFKHLKTLNSQQIMFLLEKFNQVSYQGRADFDGFKRFFPLLQNFPQVLQQGAFYIFQRKNAGFVTFRDFLFILAKFLIKKTHKRSQFIYEWLSYVKLVKSSKAEIAEIDSFLREFLKFNEDFGLQTLFKYSNYDKSLDHDLKCILDQEKILAPFQVLLTPQKQKQLLLPLINKKIKKKQKWYIISRKWKSKWKKYLDTQQRSDKPGPINNKKLVSINCEMDLKKNIKPLEFSIIPQQAWQKLIQLYGGGPTIPRPVIKKQTLCVELKPLIFQQQTPEGINYIIVSKTKKVKHLLTQTNRSHLIHQVYLLNSQTNPVLLPNQQRLREICKSRVNRCLIRCIDQSSININRPVDNLIQVRNPKFSGIKNFYNNCYISSVLQSLVHTPLISTYLGHLLFHRDLNYFSLGGRFSSMVKIVGDSVKKMMDFPQEPFHPLQLIEKFQEQKRDFQWRQQQDAHQFLRIFLDWLNEDFIRNQQNSEQNDKKSSSVSKTAIFKSSIISDLYGGLFLRSLHCQKCNYQNQLLQTFMDLSIPLPLQVSFQKYKVIFVPFKSNPIIQFSFDLEIRVEEAQKLIKLRIDLQESLLCFGVVSKHKFIKEVDFLKANLVVKEKKKIFVYQIPKRFENAVKIPINMYKKHRNVYSSIGIPLIAPFFDFTSKFYNQIIEFCRFHSNIESRGTLQSDLQVYLQESNLEKNCIFCNKKSCFGYQMTPDSIISSIQRPKSPTIKVIWKRPYKLRQHIKDIEQEEPRAIFTLEDCLTRNFNTEYLECQFCGTNTSLSKLKIKNLPDILVIHLKRFQQLGKKIRNLVNFPIFGLNLKKWCKNTIQNSTFDLFSIINHQGTHKNGHYFSYCLYDNQWKLYNDDRIFAVSDLSKLVTSDAYILFYKRREFKQINLINLQ